MSEPALAEPPAAAATPVLEVRGLDKTYPGVHALDNVDLAIQPGEVVGLVGKNGAGKSTLIKIVAGAVSPDAGQILVAGEEVNLHGTASARHHHLAFLHQELNLVPELSVAENLGLGGGYPRRGPLVNWRQLRRKAQGVLEQVRLGDLDPRTPARQLSPVEQRQVMIAAALWQEANVLILDEPTAAITDHEIARLHEIVRELRGRGVGIVYVSHRLDEVLDLVDRVVVMLAGAVVADVPANEIDKRRLVGLISGGAHIKEVAKRDRAIPEDAPVALRADGVRRAGRNLGTAIVVRAGEIVGLAGLAGSGRSSLLRGMYGADALEEGEITVFGNSLKRHSPRDSLSKGLILLTEDRRAQGLLTDFDVTKNVTLPVLRQCRRADWLPSPSKSKERTLAQEYIDRLSIKTPSGSTLVSTLSGGNQQKVLMGRWLACDGKVFLLDEPTIGIDVEAKEEVYALIRELADEGAAMVIACSDFAELAAICDRVYAITEGEVVGELRGAEVTETRIVHTCFGEHAA